MKNQMLAQGGLQSALKKSLDALEIGDTQTLVNYSFTREDIQACCNIELPAKRFVVKNDVTFDGGNIHRQIERVA